jgi:hypothetical protein
MSCVLAQLILMYLTLNQAAESGANVALVLALIRAAFAGLAFRTRII